MQLESLLTLVQFSGPLFESGPVRLEGGALSPEFSFPGGEFLLIAGQVVQSAPQGGILTIELRLAACRLALRGMVPGMRKASW